MPLVSIVIPVYNAANFLHQCLDSILGQTYRNLEILCVNDGSTDNSLEILNEYAMRDSRIKLFTKENEGKGAASARNMGLNHASGKYIMFLDSDDFFHTDLVAAMVEKAEETDSDLVCCGANRFDDTLQKVTEIYKHIELDAAPARQPFSWKDCPDQIFQICDLIAWNKLYKRELLEKYGLRFEPIPISDDQLVPALAMIFAERITTINRPLINYRYNTGSSQVDSQPKHPEAAYLATYSIVDRLKKADIYCHVKHSYLNMAVRLMREYFDKMQSYESIEFLYKKYREEVFPKLDAENLSKDFFYDGRIGEWYELITQHSLGEVLFFACRAYGAPWTTAILRFQLPYEKFPKGGRVVLVGKGLTGRYWYSQLLLSDYCEVAAWVDHIGDIPQKLEYDAVVHVAY